MVMSLKRGIGYGLKLTVLLGAVLAVLAACEEESLYIPDGGGGTGQVGDKCNGGIDCLIGLVCTGYGFCQKPGPNVPGTKGVGKPCSSYADCLRDLTCASWGQCVTQDSQKGAKKGESCKGHQDCIKGLHCSGLLKCANPGDPGTKDPGEKCTGNTDCALGLVCVNQLCTAMSFWNGVTCNAKDTGAFRALFRVPRTGKTEGEFYSLPFPNDIRLKNGKVDVTGHPDPASSLPKEYSTVVTDMLGAINTDLTGFGVNTAVLLRMSKSFNLSSITLTGTNPTLQFLNIDKKSTDYGKGPGMSMFATTGQGKYICGNYIAVRPNAGRPLTSLTTYAVLLRKGLKLNASDGGTMAVQDEDFKTMLQTGEPTDPDLKKAWQAYKPLRDYLKDKSIADDTVISAAVFTTMDPRAKVAQFRAALAAQTAPAPQQIALCDGAKKSPCDDGKTTTHKCPASASSTFHELQGLMEMPVFQKGTRPYKTPAQGGVISYDSSGMPQIQSKENLCFSLTIPKGSTMPTGGWPIVVYAHGTGGTYRSFIGDGTAENLSSITDPANASNSTAFAVISIDASMHGPRRNTTEEPDNLFFNMLNPRAARDNVYQGIADKFQLMRLVKAINLTATTSPTSKAIKFNPKHIYYFGHSQGSVEGIPFLAFEPEVKGTVLSGAGGYLIGSVLNKTKPINVAGAVRLAMADPFLGTTHPLLNMMQLLYEEVDGVNYGVVLQYGSTKGVEPKHNFLSMGISDSYTPPYTIKSLAWSMSIARLKQDAQHCGDKVCSGSETCKTCPSDCGDCVSGGTCGNASCEPSKGENCRSCPDDCSPCPAEFAEAAAPLRANNWSGGKKYTSGMVQYASDGSYDDHFVIFRDATAKKQSAHFLGSAVWDKESIPTIPKK